MNVLCESDSQRAGVVAVEPGAVLMQHGAEELWTEARNLAFWRQFPAEGMNGASR